MKTTFDWKALGAAFSLSNIFFVASWKLLVFPGMRNYTRLDHPSTFEYLAVFVNVSLLTLILLGLVRLSKTSTAPISRVFQFVFVAFGILAFGPLSHELIHWLTPETQSNTSLLLPVVVGFACFISAIKEKFKMLAAVRMLLLLALFSLPFSMMILLGSFRGLLFYDPSSFEPKSINEVYSSNYQSPLKNRVVWVVFDELDFAALTVAQYNGTYLPELEYLQDRSFIAQNAYSPNNRTLESISSLLTGIPLREAVASSPNDLVLYPSDDTEPFSLGETNDIFEDVTELGGQSGIVGWYHPYARIFDGKVSKCYWRPLAFPKCSGFRGFTSCALAVFLDAFARVPVAAKYSPSLEELMKVPWAENRDAQFERNEYLTSRALELVADRGLSMVFLHFSIPHRPEIARKSSRSKDETYFSSLEVVNDALASIRTTLEEAKLWENTVLIVSSDHADRFKRASDFEFIPETERSDVLNNRRIPFIVRFPRKERRFDYWPTVNTVITKQLILNILNGNVTDSDEMASWLNNLRNTYPDLVGNQGTGPTWK